MKIQKKWIQVLGLAMSLPSLIFACAWFIFHLVSIDIITRGVGIIILLAIVVNTLVMMVVYALKNRSKD
tara:strand:+ start:10179 stop:10385 length:207 start_codon:yes stop_codon:yes gene_type:complete